MRVLITGGGTGGHVYPALAIARGIQEEHPDADILFAGTAKGIEADIVPREGFAFRTVTVEGLPRKRMSFGAVKSLFKTCLGACQAYKIIKEFRPSIVVGTGGYVCFPVIMTASLAGIPSLIHEQNAYPGLTNKLLATRAAKVALTFKESKKFFNPKANFVVTGLPVRPEILNASKEKAVSILGLRPGVFTILVTGGSQGARSINMAMTEVIAKCSGREDIQILHITGHNGYDEIITELKDKGITDDKRVNLIVKPYLYNMQDALAAADLVVCRAGATTIAEITARGLASVLIPYPYASDNHQEYNARALVDNGAAKMILDRELTGSMLFKTISELSGDKAGLAEMAEKSRQLGRPEALKTLLTLVNDLSRV